jgi:hypothetical protein
MKDLFQTNYESFKIVNVEGFDDYGYSSAATSNNVSGQTSALNSMADDYAKDTNLINANYKLLNSQFNTFNGIDQSVVDDYEKRQYKKPGMKPESDPDSPSYSYQRAKVIHDAREEDVNTLILQQNYSYILGTITFAIVAVGAVVIARN